MIQPKDLIDKFQYAIEHEFGYIYGETHEMWSAEKQAAYVSRYRGDPDRQNSCEYGGQWAGHWVTDCSGLFKWAFSQLGGTMYHGSNTMYREWCTSKGTLRGGKRSDGKALKPGTAVFTGASDTQHGHVGLYIGGGKVIEAQGAQAGVTTSKVTSTKWTYWGELKGVAYGTSASASDSTPAQTPSSSGNGGSGSGSGSSGSVSSVSGAAPGKGYARVTATKVALRNGPSTACNVVTRVDEGEIVKIETPPGDWQYVSYNGKSGYMMKKFLKEG